VVHCCGVVVVLVVLCRIWNWDVSLDVLER